MLSNGHKLTLKSWNNATFSRLCNIILAVGHVSKRDVLDFGSTGIYLSCLLQIKSKPLHGSNIILDWKPHIFAIKNTYPNSNCINRQWKQANWTFLVDGVFTGLVPSLCLTIRIPTREKEAKEFCLVTRRK